MVITVSTTLANSARPCSACLRRLGPSKSKGLVTTATVSAPSSLASDATTGAAPVPVPPPRPAVTKTISAPSSMSMIRSVSSSAACLPTCGSEPAPNPLVIFEPMASWFGTGDAESACASVLSTANSTPLSPSFNMRATAFEPPPPTPKTRILVLGATSSSIVNFNASSAMCAPWFSICFFDFITVPLPCYPTHEARKPPPGRLMQLQFRGVEREPRSRGPRRILQLLGPICEAFGQSVAGLAIQNALGHIAHTVQKRAAAGEHDPLQQIALHADALEFGAHILEHF